MLRLEKRPVPSVFWVWGTPVLAVIATMIAGGMLFALLGKDPFLAMKAIFFDPLFGPNAGYFRPQLLVKAGPLVLIAIGLSLGVRAGAALRGDEGRQRRAVREREDRSGGSMANRAAEIFERALAWEDKLG